MKGAANNYTWGLSVSKRDRTSGKERVNTHKLETGAYQDVSCATVQKGYGVDRCTNCPLSECLLEDHPGGPGRPHKIPKNIDGKGLTKSA